MGKKSSDSLLFLERWVGSGVKTVVSTALGMTETLSWGTQARSTVFSFPMWDTQMQWLQSARDISRNLFVMMAETSAKPNKEWSVKTV